VGQTFTAYVSDRPQEAESFTIIGVLPPDLWHFNRYTDILAPLRAPTYPYLVRLRDGVTADRAASRITALVASGAARVPKGWSAQLVLAHDQYVAGVRPVLRAVTVAAILVLLVGCGNVATLFLIRAARRRKEIAVRSALGAGRSRIARMLLVETAVLGIAASALALLSTKMTLDIIAPMVQQQLGRNAPVTLTAVVADVWTAAAVFATGVAATLVCALVPMTTGLRRELNSALLGSSRTATDGAGSQRMRAMLIAFEIAASLALVAGSSLMVRSVVSLLRSDPGFSVERVLNASVTLRQQKYPDAAARMALFERMSSRLAAVPGVESVGMTTAWPLQEGRPQPLGMPDAPDGTRAGVQSVNDHYFATLRIPLLAGRAFTNGDRLGAQPVTIVSETLARRLWPAGKALGATIVVPEERDGADEPVPVPRVVVGVVRDVRQVAADSDLADAYVPILQTPGRFTFALIRTAGAPETWLTPIRAAFRDIDPEIAVQQSRPLAAAMAETTARPRFLMALLIAFAAIAGALALVGAYGVIAYAVRQREREIAVRLAIGADPRKITRLFVRQGSWIISAGLLAGVVTVLAGGRVIESELFGVTSRDPLTLAAAVVGFGAVGVVAVWWPARRAAATDPAIALRAE
jgi:predicted permease